MVSQGETRRREKGTKAIVKLPENPEDRFVVSCIDQMILIGLARCGEGTFVFGDVLVEFHCLLSLANERIQQGG